MFNKPKLYIAGPMRGLPGFNLPAFDKAEKSWTEHGYLVFSPAALIRATPYSITGADTDLQRRIHVIQQDLGCLYHCEALAILPGWEKSLGATVELALAHFLELEIYCAESFKLLNLVKTPWEFHRQMMTKVVSDLEEMAGPTAADDLNEVLHRLGE